MKKLPYIIKNFIATRKKKGISSGNGFVFFIKRVLLYGLSLLVFLCLSVYLGFWGALPSEKALLERRHDQPSEVYSADGVLLGRYFIHDKKEIPINKISDNVISALLATEDVRFYSHQGIDARSMLRVFFKTLLFQHSASGGGSTITQQLAKNLYPRRNYWILSTPVNKIREMIIATRLEGVYDKKEILELYLNSVHMGGNVYGIERGSWTYFNKSAATLTTSEAAMLIGLLKASTKYNPLRNPDAARERRNTVLSQMEKYGYLSAVKASELRNSTLKLNPGARAHRNGTLAPYFRELLRQKLLKWCAEHQKKGGENYNLYSDGLKIYTTINSKAQRHAEAAVTKRMSLLQRQFNSHWKNREPWGKNDAFIEAEVKKSRRYKTLADAGKTEEQIQKNFNTPVLRKLYSHSGTISRTLTPRDSVEYYQKFLNTGLVAMEPQTGYIRAWVGGIDYNVFKYDHVLSKRQVGSTFKPILYAAALESGVEPCQVFDNKQLSYGDWTPRNADRNYEGQYTLVQALAHSVNTISAQVIDQIGITKTISVAKRLGIESEMPAVKSLALGTAELSLLEMVTAYSTLANQGIRSAPVFITRITGYAGEVLEEHVPNQRQQAIAANDATSMIEMMKSVIDQGSAHVLRNEYQLQMDIAGKTGTTQNQADGWFIGVIPGLVTGVWVGGENPAVRFRTLTLGQGANTALPVWAEFIKSYARSTSGSLYYQARFPELSAEMRERLACLTSAPETEADPFTGIFDFLFQSKSEREERKEERKRKKTEKKQRQQDGQNRFKEKLKSIFGNKDQS